MKNNKLALAGIKCNAHGQWDGFGVAWLVSDDRHFGDILLDWLLEIAQGNVEKFIHTLLLEDVLHKEDILSLISGDKVPSRNLTHFLCASVPTQISSWLVLRNRGYAAAGNGHAEVTISASALKAARLQKLQEIAAAPVQPQNGEAMRNFLEWLTEIIDKTAYSLGRVAHPEKSMAHIANALSLSIQELKGIIPLKKNNVAEKAMELANLLNLEGDAFDVGISLAVSAWSETPAIKSDMAYSKAVLFLRHMQGMSHADFAAILKLHTRFIFGIERATILTQDNFLARLTKCLHLSTEEQALLWRVSMHYNEALKGELCAELEKVSNHFAKHGLNFQDLIDAAKKEPILFYQKAPTLIGNIEKVVNHFKADGLTFADYLTAGVKKPTLFSQKPETLISNIERVVNHFKPHDLTLANYVGVAVKKPQLFYQKPRTLISNIEGVVNYFEPYGLTLIDYLGAAVKQPQLFYQKPETLIGNINLVIAMYENGLIAFNIREKGGKNIPHLKGDGGNYKAVFAFLVKAPALMCLARDNYLLRSIYSAVNAIIPSSYILTKPKGKVEDELKVYLDYGDNNLPVPKIDQPEGLYDAFGNSFCKDASGNPISPEERSALMKPYAKNLLLRALIREKILTGTLEQNQGHIR